MPATAAAAPQMSNHLNGTGGPFISSAMEQSHVAVDAFSVMHLSGANVEPTRRKPLWEGDFNARNSADLKEVVVSIPSSRT